MGGQPVWLASCSVLDLKRVDAIRGGPLLLSTELWTPQVRKEAERQLRLALAGVGNDALQRCFRMSATLCIHRAVTEAEHAGLPEDWKCTAPRDLAGAPLEVLWHTPGVPRVLSAEPCRRPGRQLAPELAHLGIFFLVECRACDTCDARKKRQAEALDQHTRWLAEKAEARLEEERKARSSAAGRELTAGEAAQAILNEER